MTSQAPHHIAATVGANIRSARKARGMTQRELAVAVNGVDTLAVSRWERGTSMPNPRNLVVLASVLGLEVSEFFVKEAA